LATAAAFFTYFVIMEVYGFSPSTLFGLLGGNVMLPINPYGGQDPGSTGPIYSFQSSTSTNFQYTFDDNDINKAGPVTLLTTYFGTTNIGLPQYVCGNPINKNNGFSQNFPNWLATINAEIDLRGFYVTCQQNSSAVGGWQYKRIIPTQITLGTLSSDTGTPVAYTT
jgi:hypothetical protein